MLIDADCIKDVMDKLQPDDFYVKQNGTSLRPMYSMFSYSRAIDGVTVAEEMQKNGTYDNQTTRPYLVQLMELTPTSANVMEYVGIIRDKSCCGALPRPPGDHRHGPGGPGGGIRHSEAASRRSTPSAGAAAPGAGPRAQLIKPFLDQLNDLASGKTPARPAQRLLRRGSEKSTGSTSPTSFSWPPARRGQELLRSEHGAERGRQSQKTVAVFSLEMSRSSCWCA